MSSNVQISNLAIAALGHKAFIQSMTEDSVEARYANLFYERCRKSTLRAHPWNFATVRKNLALLGTGPGNWAYSYALPNGCRKARYIVPSIASIKEPFEIALSEDGSTRVVYTNKEDAVLVYTFDVVNPDLFDDLFVDAFSLNLAVRLAPTIAPSKSQEMTTRFVNTLRQAQAVDASEGEPEDVAETDWLEARLGGSTTYIRTVE